MTAFEQHMNEAHAHCAEGQYEVARASYRRACALEPGAAHAWCNLAAVDFLLGDIPAATTHYQQALDLDPSLAEARLGMVRSSLARKDWKRARELLDLPADEEASHTAERRYLEGIAWEGLGDTEAALRSFKTAAAASYVPAVKAWVRTLARAGRPAEAMEGGFRVAASAALRWTLVEYCLAASPANLLIYEHAARLFLEAQQYAYAARVRVRAARAEPTLVVSEWPALKEVSWF